MDDQPKTTFHMTWTFGDVVVSTSEVYQGRFETHVFGGKLDGTHDLTLAGPEQAVKNHLEIVQMVKEAHGLIRQ